jgi:uncharacterized protein (DUF433 family)
LRTRSAARHLRRRSKQRTIKVGEEMGEVRDRIEIDPNVHFGKPYVTGTRIPVQSVLELVSEGLSFAKIIEDYYPEMEVKDIRACVRYATEVVAAEEIHIATPA